MSNERIDLTQFEGMTGGPWFIDIEDKPMRLRKVWTDEDDAKHSIPDYDLDKFDVAIVEHISPEAGFTISKPNFRGIEMVPELIAELKRCYEELDSLPTRWQMREIHDYTKWLETVESYFLADGSFNQDADFVRVCAVNEKYGYRIEIIDGVETVVHESEY